MVLFELDIIILLIIFNIRVGYIEYLLENYPNLYIAVLLIPNSQYKSLNQLFIKSIFKSSLSVYVFFQSTLKDHQQHKSFRL